jgi:hypothetical protein
MESAYLAIERMKSMSTMDGCCSKTDEKEEKFFRPQIMDRGK